MKVLITGICGFVGATLAKSLLDQGVAEEIIGIDNFSRPGSERNRDVMISLGVEIIRGDIRSASDVDALPRVDWVIDAAANASVLAGVDGKTDSRQLVENNLFGTVNLLEYCKRHRAGFVLLSTSRVYSIRPLVDLKLVVRSGAFEPIPNQDFPLGISQNGISENFPTTAPVSLYGSTKIASECLALEYGESFDFPVWVNRCGVMAGAGQFGQPAQGIFAFWIHSFCERSPLNFIGFGGNGFQVRDCLHPRDLVPVLVKQFAEPIDSAKPRTANFSGGVQNSMSLANLTNWCGERFGPMPVHSNDTDRRFDLGWMVLDSKLAKRHWDWQPETPINAVLDEIAKFAVENPDWLAVSNPTATKSQVGNPGMPQ